MSSMLAFEPAKKEKILFESFCEYICFIKRNILQEGVFNTLSFFQKHIMNKTRQHSFTNLVRVLLIVFFIAGSLATLASDTTSFNREACLALIRRILPRHASHFIIEPIGQEKSQDVFELESKGDKIVLRGNNGVAVASALNYYLKNYIHADISWNGINLPMPARLPAIPKKIHQRTSYTYRHYFNYCTFNYTSSWWDWDRWEKEIDFMALNGINMPLAMTGQNSVWDRVYRSMGMTDKDMDAFFTGPAYFMWFWAGNIDGLNGPLSQSFLKKHEDLQKKILARERELGMKPVLPAFTGHVPPTFKDKFPNAKLRKVNWEGRFADTYLLEASDPMFAEIGAKFMEEQIKTFGTDHLYGADTFNEMIPPSNDSSYLAGISKAVYNSMAVKDPEAVWVMQGWLFNDKRDFWQLPQISAYLGAVPDDKMIVLDLWADENPVWDRSNAFFGKPWIWCMLHNFGGRNSLFGDMPNIAKGPAAAIRNPKAGKLQGLGLVPEGIEQNPAIYSLMLEHVWDDQPVDLDKWLVKYAERRYGQRNKDTEKAWQILKNTVYSGDGSYETAIIARPTLEKDNDWAGTDIPYNPAELIKAWTSMLAAAPKFAKNDCYQFDLVTIGRQVLANYATVLQQRFAKNYKSRNKIAFAKNTALFIDLINDLDKLMGTRKDFLLGPWLDDAKKWGSTEAESKLFEMNARDLITLWGGKDAVLHEYANKQWSGLFTGFYKKRWEMFIRDAGVALKNGTNLNQEQFDEKVKEWEWQWVNSNETYPLTPVGDPVAVSKAMYTKYAAMISKDYLDNPELTK